MEESEIDKLRDAVIKAADLWASTPRCAPEFINREDTLARAASALRSATQSIAEWGGDIDGSDGSN